MNRKFAAAGLVMVASIAVTEYVTRRTFNSFTDFDLYYFGGLAERHSTYTDNALVLHLASNAHRLVSHDGVYGSPSLIGLFFQPLTFLKLRYAHWLWEVLAIAGVLAAFRKAGGRYWPLWVALLYSTYSFAITNQWANFHMVTVALLVYSYGALTKGEDKRAGVALGFAVAFKLFPALLILALLFTRKWMAFKATVVTTVLLLVATVPALGADAWTDFHNQLSVGGKVSSLANNISLPSVVLSGTNSQWWARTCAAVGILVLVAVLYNYRECGFEFCFAVALTITQIVSSITWVYYASLLVITLLELVRRRQGPAILAGVLALFMTCLPGENLILLFRSSGISPNSQLVFVGMFLFLGALVLARHLSNQPEPAS